MSNIRTIRDISSLSSSSSTGATATAAAASRNNKSSSDSKSKKNHNKNSLSSIAAATTTTIMISPKCYVIPQNVEQPTVAKSLLERILREFLPILQQRQYNIRTISELCCCDDGLRYEHDTLSTDHNNNNNNETNILNNSSNNKNNKNNKKPNKSTKSSNITKKNHNQPTKKKRKFSKKASQQNQKLWGYNRTISSSWNKKYHEIHLRLRQFDDHSQFLSYHDIAGTMAHEMAHCIHGPHNDQFYQLMDQILEQHAVIMASHLTKQGETFPTFGGQGYILGHATSSAGSGSSTQQRQQQSSHPGYQLGGDNAFQQWMTPMEAAVVAAEARQRQLQLRLRGNQCCCQPCIIEIEEDDDDDDSDDKDDKDDDENKDCDGIDNNDDYPNNDRIGPNQSIPNDPSKNSTSITTATITTMTTTTTTSILTNIVNHHQQDFCGGDPADSSSQRKRDTSHPTSNHPHPCAAEIKTNHINSSSTAPIAVASPPTATANTATTTASSSVASAVASVPVCIDLTSADSNDVDNPVADVVVVDDDDDPNIKNTHTSNNKSSEQHQSVLSAAIMDIGWSCCYCTYWNSTTTNMTTTTTTKTNEFIPQCEMCMSYKSNRLGH